MHAISCCYGIYVCTSTIYDNGELIFEIEGGNGIGNSNSFVGGLEKVTAAPVHRYVNPHTTK